nr:serine/threonine-protein kinase pim-1-like [Labrus bergylta]
MAFKSSTARSTAHCSPSREQLRCHSEPVFYAEENCRSKSNRSSQSSRDSCSLHIISGPPSSDCSNGYFRVNSCTSDSTGETLSLSPPHFAAVLDTLEIKTSSKRKSTTADTEEGPKKRSRGTPIPAEDHTSIFSGSFSEEDSGTFTSNTSISVRTEDEGRKSRKRKSEETEGPRTRSRTNAQTPAEESCREDVVPSSTEDTAHSNDRAVFEAQYKEKKLLGEGGFGSVFAGYRRKDNLPVAIKHIRQSGIVRTSMLLDGEISMVPLEVVLMLKVKPAASGTRAAVALLDWYDLDDELILVLERPVPCCDLIDYMNSRGSGLQEHEAKVFAKQLVDAVIEIHSRGVFHCDIKMENILVETGSEVPRVRLIDFGCSTFLSDGTYKSKQGTFEYTSPEWFTDKEYRAEPATVWQLGVVIFGLLHEDVPFESKPDIVYGYPYIRESLSTDCCNFLLSCLSKIPEYRPTLETLRNHPWLI